MSKDNCEFIKNIKPFELSEYSGVSSREKLVVYTIKFLSDNFIPTTFDYVCMAAYKLFPDEFKLSDEFPEQADIAGLNRTLMHLRPGERNLASGKPNTSYVLNVNGYELAKQVEEGLNKKLFESNIKTSSNHDKIVQKKNKEKYLMFVKNSLYFEYLQNMIYSQDLIWRFFKTIPFLRMEAILKDLKEIKMNAKEEKNEPCLKLCTLMENDLKKFIKKKKNIEKGRM